jgi:hypothetical protein
MWFLFLESISGFGGGTSTSLLSDLTSRCDSELSKFSVPANVVGGVGSSVFNSILVVEVWHWFQACNNSWRLLVKAHSSLYCHLRLRGVLPDDTSLMPLLVRLLADCLIASR